MVVSFAGYETPIKESSVVAEKDPSNYRFKGRFIL